MTSRELLIVRHAKSDWSNNLASDIERPLNSRGEKDAPKIAKWIHSQQIVPDALLCSPARRAKQTANAIIEELKLPDTSVAFDKRLYLASLSTLLAVIAELGDSVKTVMLVGHNPGLEELIFKLCDDHLPFAESGKLLTTANVVMLQFNCDWQNIGNTQGKLLHFIRPRDLS